jgi:hypothetical protein
MSRTEPDLQDCEDCIAPAEAFSVVANETRLSILEALWQVDDRPASFSDIREQVGTRDSAQFNYHLQELTDGFVLKTDDGYDLRTAGEKVVRAVLAGSFNEHPRIAPFDVAGECTACGSGLSASYGDERMHVLCTDCGKSHGRYSFPPGGLKNRDREELMAAFEDRVRHLHCLAADGVCPECSGRMHTEIIAESEHDDDCSGEDCCLDLSVRAEHLCEQCRLELCSPVGMRLLDRGEVVSFYADHGVNLSERPYWTLPWCVDDDYTEVVDVDPMRLAVRMPAGDEELVVTVDDDVNVREVERTAR